MKKLSDLCDLSDFTLTICTPGGSLWQRHEVVYHHEHSQHLGRIEPLAEPGQCHRSLIERPSVGRHSLPKMTVTGVRCKHQTWHTSTLGNSALKHLDKHSQRLYWSRHLRWLIPRGSRKKGFQQDMQVKKKLLFWVCEFLNCDLRRKTLFWIQSSIRACHCVLVLIIIIIIGLQVTPTTDKSLLDVADILNFFFNLEDTTS